MADDFVTPERVRFTQAVRHLIDVALTAEHVTEARLHDAADTAERLAAELGAATTGAPTRSVRTRQGMDHDDYLPRSPLVGDVSPMAPPLVYEFRDGRIHARRRVPRGLRGTARLRARRLDRARRSTKCSA